MVLKLLDRFPIVITLGAALLGWIAGGLIINDPAGDRWPVLDTPRRRIRGMSIAGALFVVILGYVIKRRNAEIRGGLKRRETSTPARCRLNVSHSADCPRRARSAFTIKAPVPDPWSRRFRFGGLPMIDHLRLFPLIRNPRWRHSRFARARWSATIARACRRVGSRLGLGLPLIELMIVLAIVGVIAAYAIPRIRTTCARSRVGEGCRLRRRRVLPCRKTRRAATRSAGGYASPPATRNVESGSCRRRQRADHRRLHDARGAGRFQHDHARAVGARQHRCAHRACISLAQGRGAGGRVAWSASAPAARRRRSLPAPGARSGCAERRRRLTPRYHPEVRRVVDVRDARRATHARTDN